MLAISPRLDHERVTREWALRAAAALICWVAVGAVVGWSILMDQTFGVVVLLAGGLLILAFWGHPRIALVAWMMSLTMIPIWVSIDISATIPAHCLVAMAAVAATLSSASAKVTKFDAYFILFLAAAFAAVLVGGSAVGSWAQILVRWGTPFLAARILTSATGMRFAISAFAAVGGLVGGLAVLEYLLAWHPFAGWAFGSTEYEIWQPIQTRRGGDRSEWAFGHSIALGGSLALSIPFVIGSSFKLPIKTILMVLVIAGVITTASRSALVAAGITGAICMAYYARHRGLRSVMLATAVISAILVAPNLQEWARGTSDEEQQSFEYRNYLYTTFIKGIEWFGRSSDYGSTRNQSTDSAILQLGLGFGWLVLIVALLPLFISAFRTLAGRGSIADIALVGQIPLFISVAFITQYESLVFFVVGLAVQMVLFRNQREIVRLGVPSTGPLPSSEQSKPAYA